MRNVAIAGETWLAGTVKLTVIWMVAPASSAEPASGCCTEPSGKTAVTFSVAASACPSFCTEIEYGITAPVCEDVGPVAAKLRMGSTCLVVKGLSVGPYTFPALSVQLVLALKLRDWLSTA